MTMSNAGMAETEYDRDMRRVKEATVVLMEHFDTVQIFVTRCDPDGTTNVQSGSGNWFARRGQVQYWLTKENESARVEVRKYNADNE